VTTSHTYSAAGTYNVVLTVTDNEGATGTVSHGVTVTEPTEPPHMSSFAVSAPSSVTAGSSFNVVVTAKDQFGNTFSSYSGTVTLTSGDSQAVLPGPLAISGGSGTFTGVVLKTSGSQSLTATAGSYTGSTNVAVEHAAAASFDVTPATATIGAGSAQAYTGTAKDEFGNYWVVSASTTWGITTGAGGSWASNVYTSEVVGTWTVTGTYLTFTDTATLEVTYGAVDHITVSPSSQSLTAGESQAYTATAYDAIGNNWDVTATASWSITTGAEGSWTGNTYTCAKAGTWTVTALYSGKSATSQLEVTRGAAASITVTPASETIVAGESQEYTAMADDGYGNTWDVTASTDFEILESSHGGSWSTNTYTSAKAGTWTVQATYDTTLTDTAVLTVEAGALHHFVFDTISSPKTVGTPFSITITAKDALENTVTSYVGTNTLTVSAGTISITTTTAFTGGVWTGDVSISPVGTDITISTAASSDATKTGTSNEFDITPATQTIILRPTGSGSTTQLSLEPYREWRGYYYYYFSNYEHVDEASSDGDSSYVYRDGSERMDTYAMRNASLSLSTINKVTIHYVARVDSSGSARPVIRTNGVNYYGTSQALTTSYVEYTFTWEKNPYTDVAWTWAGINSLEAGIALQDSGSGNAKCTQIWIEVEYIPSDTSATPLVLRPNAAGTTTGLSRQGDWNNYACVDESGSHDGDDTYVYRNDNGAARDTYNISDSAIGGRPIQRIVVHFVARERNTETQGTARAVIRTGSTDYYGTSTDLTSSYTEYTSTWETNPNTSTTWTWADIDSLEIGIELTRTSGTSNIRCTQVWVEIIYAP